MDNELQTAYELKSKLIEAIEEQQKAIIDLAESLQAYADFLENYMNEWE